MDNVIHFIKHALGLCGEPHPSLLMGGVGIVSYCIYCMKDYINIWKNKNDKV